MPINSKMPASNRYFDQSMYVLQLYKSTAIFNHFAKIRHKHTLTHIILAQPKMVRSLKTLYRTYQTSMAQLTTLITRNYSRASTNIINTT